MFELLALWAFAQASPMVRVGDHTKLAVATVLDRQAGDAACYLTLRDDQGQAVVERADFAVCEAEEEPVGLRVELRWRVGTVMADDCEGDPDCRRTQRVALISSLSPVDDTAANGRLYEDVNRAVPTMTVVTTTARRPGVDYPSELTAWLDPLASTVTVAKIRAVERDDSGDVVTDFYFRDGDLWFVYQAIYGFDERGQQVVRNETRQYFRDGRQFRLLGGLDQVAQSPSLEWFSELERASIERAAAFLSSIITRRLGSQ
jgi:hypothetical protein